jgi:acetyl esterase/lipase
MTGMPSATVGLPTRISLPSIRESSSESIDSPRGGLKASGPAPATTASKTSALSDPSSVSGPDKYAPTKKDLKPATTNLGGLGRSFNAIKNFFRDQLFGSSEARKGQEAHEYWDASAKNGDGAWKKTKDPATGKTMSKLSYHQNEVRSQPNVAPMSITNAKGHRLDGHFYTPQGSLKNGIKPGEPDTGRPVVLLLTGSGGTAEEYGCNLGTKYSQQLDANVMSINYRGYGTSQGKPTEKGLYQDAQAMYDHLVKDMGFKPDQIIIHGFSMGASVAAQLHKAADDHGVQLKGVVYDRPMVSTKDATEAHVGSSKIGSIAKWAVGKMDVGGTVPQLNDKSTPILVSHDRRKDSDNQDVRFAIQGKAFGDGLTTAGFTNVNVVGTGADHMDHDRAATAMGYQLGRMVG